MSKKMFVDRLDNYKIDNLKLYRNEGKDGSTRSPTFDSDWYSMESLVGTKNVVFCSDYTAPSFYQNWKELLTKMFAGEDSRDSNPRSYSSLPCVVDRGEPSRWTIVGNMLEERHTSCTLKTSYVDSDKKFIWWLSSISISINSYLKCRSAVCKMLLWTELKR
jgi:hypothetical protein